ncbi:branched-chain amino acid aminotransferase [Actinacidiphila glaucinigra]|uniref:branched-chain amino acid aminotransferase n=1 Tax=Actinacidiphila glaucinigra TaxID=235986 RepID=UPI0036E9F53F
MSAGDDPAPLGFGNRFTSHMVVARWTTEKGWGPAGLTGHRPLELPPTAMALHYGQAIFEGLKAYAAADGTLALFRPWFNAERFARSAARLAMPELPPQVFVAACETLARADADEVPRGQGQSLYLRPFMIAVEPNLGVRPSREYLFAVVASPVDHFFAGGGEAIDVWCPDGLIRAAPGGTGAAKCAGNYAGSLATKAEALANGCQEVLWLDALEHRWIEELGAMNFFCAVRTPDGETQLVTPALSDTILAGNIRDSLLRLAAGLGHRVTERPVALAELTADDSRVTEAFACGTAASVVPIGAIRTPRGRTLVGDGRPGKLTAALRDELAAVQYGRQHDAHGWMHPVPGVSLAPSP